MDSGIAAICGALVGALTAFGTSTLTYRAQRETTRATVRAEYRKEVREPRRDAYRKLISVGMDLAERARGELIWAEQSHVSQALNLKDAVDQSWLEISLLGPANTLNAATEVRRNAYLVFDCLWSLYAFWNSTLAEDEEARSNRLAQELESSAFPLLEAVLDLSRSAQLALEDTGVD
ncbi:hypothetical protein N4G70_00380 [Streptomyces sp. ASQP_92]|uniref:hypothetical protein n=1 Tax=Streptomyces sp. ASQP_92 TaxID=2979116 RepID=UPI0021C111AB|nr:hypothetical protein [Streptomyces sp. ASQP_92]MCT9087321.1 hypothetical protein [Streptomyces sp. ASQP_92]